LRPVDCGFDGSARWASFDAFSSPPVTGLPFVVVMIWQFTALWTEFLFAWSYLPGAVLPAGTAGQRAEGV